MPLNDLLDVYGQDILNGVSEDSWRAVSGEDGNIYGIPYKYPYAQEVQGFMVCRWDLMQEAGIEAIPTTIDEFYDCLVKLKEHFGDQYIIFSGPVPFRLGRQRHLDLPAGHCRGVRHLQRLDGR